MDLNINMCVHCGVKVKDHEPHHTQLLLLTLVLSWRYVSHSHKHCGVYITCVTHQETLEHKDRFAWSLGKECIQKWTNEVQRKGKRERGGDVEIRTCSRPKYLSSHHVVLPAQKTKDCPHKIK